MKGKTHKCIKETVIRRLVANAISNERYEPAIRKLSSHVGCLPDDRKYSLALLYDHQVSRMKRPRSRRLRYIENAEVLYRGILNRNPRHALSWLGMGRVETLKGNIARALAFEKKAYKLLTRLPRENRGALGIGALYERAGRLKLAERWYLNELQLCGPDDFGTTLNLFRFYVRAGLGGSAKSLAPLLRRLLNREFRKPQYLGLGMQNSKFIREIRHDLATASR